MTPKHEVGKNMGGRLMQKKMKFDVSVMAFLKVTFMIVFLSK